MSTSSGRLRTLSLSGTGNRVPNVLTVCILEARDLVVGDESTGTSDAFVRVDFSGQEFKTRTEDRKSSHFYWDERVKFIAARNKLTKVRFQVFDKDRFKDEMLGKAYVDVNTLRELKSEYVERQGDVSRSMWLKLTDKFGTEGDFGQIRVSIGWSYEAKLTGKSRLAFLSRLGITRTMRGENIDVLMDDANSGTLEASGLEEEEDDEDESIPYGNADDQGSPNLAGEESDSSSSSSSGTSSGDGGDNEEKRKTRAEKRQEREAKMQAELEAFENIEIKSGTWRIIFHVIEVRDLKPEDLQGTSDPCCTVSALIPTRKPAKRSTSIKKSVRSCVFDEQLFLDLPNMDRNVIEATTIKFSVYDADLISRNDLIGSFTFNMIDVYYQKQKNIWVGLIDEQNPKDQGIQGYAKVSVLVLGPGDKASLYEEGEDPAMDSRDEEIGEVLLPPSVRQPLHFLRLRIYQATELPALDSSVFNSDAGGIDCFFRVEFSGNPRCKSKTITAKRGSSSETLRCVFNEEMWLPTFNHRLAKNINIAVYDRDKTSKNDLVSTVLINYQNVIRVTDRFPKAGRIPPRWYNLYGAPPSKGSRIGAGKDRHAMNRNPALASSYRGRILVELLDFADPDGSIEKEQVHKKFIRSIRQSQLPKTCKYVLRLWAISASEVPKTNGVLMKSKTSVQLAISIGTYRVSTKTISPSKFGTVNWLESLELEVEFPRELLDLWDAPKTQQLVRKLDHVKQDIRALKATIPDDLRRLRTFPGSKDKPSNHPDLQRLQHLQYQRDLLQNFILKHLEEAQVPDIFLYLENSEGESISFTRYKPGQLLLEKFTVEPKWVPLIEDKGNNKLDDEDFPGNVLVAMGMGSELSANESRDRWAKERLLAMGKTEGRYLVRVHVYQGVVPSADSDALSDPFAKVSVLGATKRISKRKRTCDPLWFETVEFENVSLPTSPWFSPQILIDVYDYDKYDSDDYLGTARIPIFPTIGHGDLEQNTFQVPYSTRPEWYPMFQVKPGDCGDSCVLVSIDLFDMGNPSIPPIVPILPEYREEDAKLQVVILGCRNLEDYKALPIMNPLVQFHLGDPSQTRNIHQTKRDKGANPNFGQLVEIPFQIPKDLIFLPRLHVAVQESRFGGATKPIVATRVIDINPYVPVSLEYLPPNPDLEEGMKFHSKYENPNVSTVSGAHGEEEIDLLLLDHDEQLVLDHESPPRDGLEYPETIVTSYFSDPSSSSDGSSYGSGDEGEDDEGEMDPDLLGNILDDDNALEFVEWKHHDPLPLPKWMEKRPTYDHELENELGKPPFESFELFRGSMIRKSLLGRKLKPNFKKVGIMKAVIRVVMGNDDVDETGNSGIFDEDMLAKIMLPTPVHVRLNVLMGFNFIPMDVLGGKSDPYLSIKLGSQKINDQKNYIPNTVNPAFYKVFTLQTTLPGPSLLKIKAMDYDTFSSDDLIGITELDLEDRWFSQRWHQLNQPNEERRKDQMTDEELGESVPLESDTDLNASSAVDTYFRKPCETRSLWTPTSQLEQGKLEMFVDILDPATALKYPKLHIAPPNDTVYELRVIVWKAEKVPAFDMFTKMNDMYVKCNFNGFSDKKWASTDVHWRAKNGKASWNYRLKFPNISLPLSKLKSRLTLQIWDKDVTKYSDMIAECVLDLDKHLKACFLRKDEVYEVFDSKIRRAPVAKKSIISTKEVPVQPEEEQFDQQQMKDDDEISIEIDEYTGVPKTNCDPDDIDSHYDEKRKMKRSKKKKKKKKNKKTAERNMVTAQQQAKAKDDADDDSGHARELIDNYLPWFSASRVPPNSKALKLVSTTNGVQKDMGLLYVSIQLLRQDVSDGALSNGKGRSEPNRFPKLPPPVGRMKWSLLWNPFYLMRECLGPELCWKFCCCFIVLIVIVASIFLMPEIGAIQQFFSTLPKGVGEAIIVIVVILIVACCIYCAVADKIRERNEQRELEKAYDIEQQAYNDERRKEYEGTEYLADEEETTRCCSCCYRPKHQKSKRVETASDSGDMEMLQL